MNTLSIITSDKKALNKIEFDTVSKRLYGILNILSKLKREFSSINGNFMSMLELVKLFTDTIISNEKQVYDTQCQALLQTINMYLSVKDSNDKLYINPASETDETTDINMTINFPNYTITRTILKIDNISIDLAEWDIKFGSMIIHLQKMSDIVEPIKRDDFIACVIGELEKILLVNSQICRLEQAVNSNIKYITELKSIGL